MTRAFTGRPRRAAHASSLDSWKWTGWKAACLGLLLVCATACATTTRLPEPVPLRIAQTEIPPEELIEVVVAPFSTGVPEDPSERDEEVFAEVRKAEARYVATHLKKTLESSGQWAAVGIAPPSNDIGLEVEGEILHSNGEELALEIRAKDATGRVWLEKRYRSRIPVSAYLPPASEEREPFQHLYHEISNDLVEAREELSSRERIEINQVAELRFAESLAPDAFGERLETDSKGRTRVLRLPAREDAMLGHVRAIRDRDRALRETLDEGYLEFYDDLFEPYYRWRSFTADETIALRKVERESYLKVGLGALAFAGGIALAVLGADPGSATAIASDILTGPLIVGGVYTAGKGFQQLGERSIHIETIEELGTSFEADVTPRVLEIEGETIRITGNAETQYREWRRLLRAIYQAETGLPVSLPVSPNASGDE